MEVGGVRFLNLEKSVLEISSEMNLKMVSVTVPPAYRRLRSQLWKSVLNLMVSDRPSLRKTSKTVLENSSESDRYRIDCNLS